MFSKDIQMYFSFIYIHIGFNNKVIRNVSCSFLLPIKFEKHYIRQYLAKGSVSSKYRVESESKKSNVNYIPIDLV